MSDERPGGRARGFTTRALHQPAKRPDPWGALRTPVYDTAAFEFPDAESIQAAFEGTRPAHVYSRSSNPTIEDFELRLTALAGGVGAVAVASGMAAITALTLTLAESGMNVVTTRALFGNTISLDERTLAPWGLETRPVAMTDLDAVAAAIDGRTAFVFLEAISNPGMEVADIPAIVAIAGARGVPVIVDGTATTPYLFPSREWGVAVEIGSTTKFITGGATSIGGVLIDNGTFDWRRSARLAAWLDRPGPSPLIVALRREVYRNLGACLSPHNAYLQTLGLETLALRADRACANALAVARFLEAHPKVRRVNYPGLASSPTHGTALRLLPRGFGGILSFELADRAACYRAMDAMTIPRRATNVNDNKSLVIHPASTIYTEFGPDERASMGVTEGLIRLSVGIEDLDDLLADLGAALERA